MFEGLFIGDIHLDQLKNIFPSQHIELQLNEVRKPLQYAVELGLNTVIFGGDISHNIRLSYEAQLAFMDMLHEYDGLLDIHIILGNHDVRNMEVHSLQHLTQLCRMKKFRTVRVYDKPHQLTFDSTIINFLPYPYSIPPFSLGPTVNIGHLSVVGAKHDSNKQVSTDWVPDRKKDVWLMGHQHLKQKIGNVWYPGTLYQLSFGEELPKGWIHFNIDTQDNEIDADISWVQNDPAFKLINLPIEIEKDLDKVGSNPLHKYKLWLKGGLVLPPTFLKDHPNVYTIVGYTHKHESGVLGIKVDCPKWSVTTGLRTYLTSKVTKKQAFRGHRLVQKFLGTEL